ncbi:MAG: 1-acyl-sn-glycerol-3-phosphate acyltransferase [Polyangiales bacterium]
MSTQTPPPIEPRVHEGDGARHEPASALRRLRKRAGETWLKAFDWSVAGSAPKVDRAVIIAAPHTSNWDLPFMLAIAWALDIDIRWIGKHTLFKPPFGPLMKLLGGLPVDRRARHNAVDAAAALIKEYEARDERLLLVVPPEGTRGRAGRWKTGFYWIAKEAHVPVVLGFLDYAHKRGGLGEVFDLSGDIDADFRAIVDFYSPIKGKFPDQQGAVTLHVENRPQPTSASSE